MCTCGQACAMVCVEVKDNLIWFFPSIIWVLGIEFRTSDLAVGWMNHLDVPGFFTWVLVIRSSCVQSKHFTNRAIFPALYYFISPVLASPFTLLMNTMPLMCY